MSLVGCRTTVEYTVMHEGSSPSDEGSRSCHLVCGQDIRVRKVDGSTNEIIHGPVLTYMLLTSVRIV